MTTGRTNDSKYENTRGAGVCRGIGWLHDRGRATGRIAADCGAGFSQHPADTPQKAAKLQALPQHTIVYAQRKHGTFYIYADAAGCNCAYIGNAAAYQQYQQLRAANNLAEMQETTAMLNADAAMDWGGVWGPVVPGWY